MNLSDHFTLEEMTASQAAARKGLDNTPSPGTLEHLKALCMALERVRAVLGHPLIISSGYRSPAVNAAVGGAANSAHVMGYAADFICPAFGPPLKVSEAISDSGIKFDQVIHEFGVWCHLSVDPRMRGQLLTISKAGTQTGLHPVGA